MGLKVGTVKLEKFNDDWIKMYNDEKEILSKMFGDVAISIEHIGSTSIKGLSAKPIIDIAVGVDKLSDFDEVKNNFLKFPYSINDTLDDEILIRKGDENNRTHFIHVMEYLGDNYKDHIIFRDYLLNHHETVLEYQKLKEELAKKYSDNRKKYTASKNDFIQNIINIAKKDI